MTTHQHNLQWLVVDIFKTAINNLVPTFIKLIFNERDAKHSLRNKRKISFPNAEF